MSDKATSKRRKVSKPNEPAIIEAPSSTGGEPWSDIAPNSSAPSADLPPPSQRGELPRTDEEAAAPANYTLVQPGAFEPSKHFYTRVLNAHIHPLVRYFMDLGNRRIAERYSHLHPEASHDGVTAALSYATRYFRWGGADLFHVTTEEGLRRIVVIETNSCPSGNKSMPLLVEREEQAGYRALLERSFMPMLRARGLPEGELAVLYDKNPMEASAYAGVLAEVAESPVHLVAMHDADPTPRARFNETGVLEICLDDGTWLPIRAALRYVTQRPWNRIPPLARSLIYNPVIVCLAGGRNKLLAAKAYDLYNAELESDGLSIRTPETIWDVGREEVPLWVQRMGGYAVVKVPYSNAGQGVYTITRRDELDAFMELEQRYDRFIVQALIGNIGWSSRSHAGRLYHIGTVPNRHGEIFAADLRFMVGNGPEGFFPVAIYARRARLPLAPALEAANCPSWDMLG
ncbi:MAG TPA: hypothetical protein VFB62_06315, partial [Polyangiaceae bacterium]|nr:hypothetical protein [Polyangiaceae bacterium]